MPALQSSTLSTLRRGLVFPTSVKTVDVTEILSFILVVILHIKVLWVAVSPVLTFLKCASVAPRLSAVAPSI